ncbi:hypothetical protein BV898_09553 [Hypsibius exemplaris]|uniref:Protein sleepless n=1 Tax=Hypsibius exemplaris TaxID=2072580 RepID=A0A1W0WM16_HYPEX|nr:hypothetical protein BV898_09553 [Hypsibius exemplaris]
MANCPVASTIGAVVLVVLSTAAFPTASAIHCYTCNSGLDISCADSYSLRHSGEYQDCLTNPTGNSDRCVKITGPGNLISRQCGDMMSQQIYQPDGCYFDGNVQTCVCFANYCNGGDGLSFSFAAAMMLTVFVLSCILCPFLL